MSFDNGELAELRPAVQEAKLISDSLHHAVVSRGCTPDWLTVNKGCKPKSIADAILGCRNAIQRDDIVAAELIGVAAELSPTLLGRLDHSILAAIPDLIATLDAKSPSVRIAVISAISKFGKHAPLDAVEAILRRITDAEDHLEVQCEAIRAFPAFGVDKAALAVPELTERIENRVHPDISIAACRVLEFIRVEAFQPLKNWCEQLFPMMAARSKLLLLSR